MTTGKGELIAWGPDSARWRELRRDKPVSLSRRSAVRREGGSSQTMCKERGARSQLTILQTVVSSFHTRLRSLSADAPGGAKTDALLSLEREEIMVKPHG